MKDLRIFLILLIIFVLLFFYLHQKVAIYIEAYKLSKNYDTYHKLLIKRDDLKFEFAKNTSLD